MNKLRKFLLLFLYTFRAIFPMKRVNPLKSRAICTACSWSGKYNEAKHRTHNQLVSRGVTNQQGTIIDAYILNVKRRNGGWVDLSWCPKCDCFIEVYYESEDSG